MLTLLWELPGGAKEIYEVPSVSYIPAIDVGQQVKGQQYDCNGNEHVAFQSMTAVQDDESGFKPHRTVIDSGCVYVMNAMGKTVMTYRFRRFPEAAKGQLDYKFGSDVGKDDTDYKNR